MEKTAQMEFLKNQKMSNDFLKQMPRRWEAGDVYSPHDLSPVEMQKWRKKTVRNNDVIDALGISPLDMYKVRSYRQPFVTHTDISPRTSRSSSTSHQHLE
jgi:small subunit ribosomal protein S18